MLGKRPGNFNELDKFKFLAQQRDRLFSEDTDEQHCLKSLVTGLQVKQQMNAESTTQDAKLLRVGEEPTESKHRS